MVQGMAPAMEKEEVVTWACGHWEFEVQYPIAPLETESQEQSSSPRSLGTRTRRHRLTRRASSRVPCADTALEEMYNRVHESHCTLHRSWTHELYFDLATREADQRPLLREPSTSESLDRTEEIYGSVVGAAKILLTRERSPSQGSSETHRTSEIDVYEDQIPATSASQPRARVNDEPRLESSLDLWVSENGADTESAGPQQRLNSDGYGNENWDPLGDWRDSTNQRRSPLPVWFPRRPLQDITNVLSSELDDQLLQPKKKGKKQAVTSALAPTQIVLSDTIPSKRRAATTTPPKVSKSATSNKLSSTLRKGFR